MRHDAGRRLTALGAGFLPVGFRCLDPFLKRMLTLGALIFVDRHGNTKKAMTRHAAVLTAATCLRPARLPGGSRAEHHM